MKLTLDELHLEIQADENLPRTLFPPRREDRNLPRSIMGYMKFPFVGKPMQKKTGQGPAELVEAIKVSNGTPIAL